MASAEAILFANLSYFFIEPFKDIAWNLKLNKNKYFEKIQKELTEISNDFQKKEFTKVDFKCYICQKPHIAKICPDLTSVENMQNYKYIKKNTDSIKTILEKINIGKENYENMIKVQQERQDPDAKFFVFSDDDEEQDKIEFNDEYDNENNFDEMNPDSRNNS